MKGKNAQLDKVFFINIHLLFGLRFDVKGLSLGAKNVTDHKDYSVKIAIPHCAAMKNMLLNFS